MKLIVTSPPARAMRILLEFFCRLTVETSKPNYKRLVSLSSTSEREFSSFRDYAIFHFVLDKIILETTRRTISTQIKIPMRNFQAFCLAYCTNTERELPFSGCYCCCSVLCCQSEEKKCFLCHSLHISQFFDRTREADHARIHFNFTVYEFVKLEHCVR